MLHANPLQPLQNLIDEGLQPVRREFWLFLDAKQNRINGLVVSATNLPTDNDCKAIAGLDIVLVFHGHSTKYGTLNRLCGSILAARPHLFWILDLDFKKIAHLKIAHFEIGAHAW
jgi:hypothetical protein